MTAAVGGQMPRAAALGARGLCRGQRRCTAPASAVKTASDERMGSVERRMASQCGIQPQDERGERREESDQHDARIARSSPSSYSAAVRMGPKGGEKRAPGPLSDAPPTLPHCSLSACPPPLETSGSVGGCDTAHSRWHRTGQRGEITERWGAAQSLTGTDAPAHRSLYPPISPLLTLDVRLTASPAHARSAPPTASPRSAHTRGGRPLSIAAARRTRRAAAAAAITPTSNQAITEPPAERERDHPTGLHQQSA